MHVNEFVVIWQIKISIAWMRGLQFLPAVEVWVLICVDIN